MYNIAMAKTGMAIKAIIFETFFKLYTFAFVRHISNKVTNIVRFTSTTHKYLKKLDCKPNSSNDKPVTKDVRYKTP
jgi:hypothetical protein